MNAGPESEFFSDGISDEIINALTHIPDLHVTARMSSFSFKGKNIHLREVGERLNVQTLVEGSVRKAGKRIRITAQLINAADGHQFWSERYDRELENIFTLQGEIARTIADKMKVALKGEQDAPLVKPSTHNLEAYKLYLKGRALLYRRGLAIPEAQACFRRAVELDPDYALAWAGLADGHSTMGNPPR